MTFQNHSLEVQFAKPEDFPALIQLYDVIASAVKNRAFFNWNEDKASEEMRHAKTLIIKDGHARIVAFVTYRDYEDRIEISAVGTDPTQLQKGLAQKVLQALKANAVQRKLDIWLEVHESNQTAVNLYLKNGFAVLNTRKRYYPDGGHALVMRFASV